MRILVLTPGVFDKGGIARYGRAQISAIRDSFGEDSVSVFSLAGRQPGDLEEPFAVSWAGPVPLSRASRIHFAGAAGLCAHRTRPRIVLTQHVNMGPLARALARYVGARLVQNVYGLELWSGLSRARRSALARSDLVISDCHNSADYCLRAGLVSRRPEVVWDCVDLERFRPGAAPSDLGDRYGLTSRSRFRILFLARLSRDARYKGTERLLMLLSRLPEEGFEAVIAGKGDDIPHLEGLAEELGVRGRTHFTGPIHEADLPDLYRSADAFYLTSEAGQDKGEGIPLTPLEALACGTPVVVGNQDGSREIVEGECGICCDPGDLDRQAEYLARLRSDRERQGRARRAARRRAEEAFGYPGFVVKTRTLLQAAADPRASGGPGGV